MSDDKGKLLENMVFTAIRRETESIFFLKNGYECDFVVNPETDKTQLIQVTEMLHQGNVQRELQGLEKASKQFGKCRQLLIVNDIALPEKPLLPEWVELKPAWQWLLE
ncbi:ATP-binding protein [Desulfamplus magnetovallimortis]|uniref:ATP-binding protein n=1 Tax=Desulfamplus magnetovallimortis TaxID=1246637 RepID=UPI001647B6FC|nr:ATP-binding protein [Desulfamplus magnetovallimortis]